MAGILVMAAERNKIQMVVEGIDDGEIDSLFAFFFLFSVFIFVLILVFIAFILLLIFVHAFAFNFDLVFVSFLFYFYLLLLSSLFSQRRRILFIRMNSPFQIWKAYAMYKKQVSKI